MGILRRDQRERPSSPAGFHGDVGVPQPYVYNDHCHNHRDRHKYHDAGVRSFTFSSRSNSVFVYVAASCKQPSMP